MPSIYDTPFWSKGFYDHKARWIHYFNQVQYVARTIRNRERKMDGFTVLEIGPSHGFVTDYLRKFGVDVTTLDNKKEYSPTVVGSVTNIPLPDNSFDFVIICEVLEHLPFDDFHVALKEIHRVSRSTVLLSEPDSRRMLLGLKLKIPLLKPIEINIKVPKGGKPIVEKGHFWEIGVRDFPLSRIRKEIQSAGFTIAEESNPLDTPKNYYFLLKKT